MFTVKVNIMRKLLITTALAALSTLLMSDGWRTDFDRAKTDAQKNNKLILLKFSGSDWCLPCMRMEKDVFAQDNFVKFAEGHLEMFNADFPRQNKNKVSSDVAKQNDHLADLYNRSGHFPYTLLLKPDGTVLKAWDGYHGENTAAMIDQIQQYANTH
jgi:thioredoxin-related protein